MRTFWFIVAALGILAAVLFASGRSIGTRAEPRPAAAPERQPASEPAAPAPTEDVPVSQPEDRVLADLAAQAATPPAAPAASAPPAEPRAPESAPTAGSVGEPFTLPRHDDYPAERTVPSTARIRPDGAMVVDDRFLVRGKGTKDDPYRVSWEHLVSAEDVYKPRLGQKRLPERVTFLHGAYVRLTGFVAFPITSSNPRECLVMLNQWDGCCIGVPPTAYDAVEVKLAKPATGNDRLAEHGTLEGRFRVDPYEEGGWLLGLYLMDDATLKPDL